MCNFSLGRKTWRDSVMRFSTIFLGKTFNLVLIWTGKNGFANFFCFREDIRTSCHRSRWLRGHDHDYAVNQQLVKESYFSLVYRRHFVINNKITESINCVYFLSAKRGQILAWAPGHPAHACADSTLKQERENYTTQNPDRKNLKLKVFK